MTTSLRDELQAIYDQRGVLTPRLVVDVARDPAHPLHNRFEWNDAVAGERWREQQAHELIRSVRVVYRDADDSGPERSVRAFHAIRKDSGHVYEPADRVAHDPVMNEVLRMDMRREWHALRRRWEGWDEFTDMVRQDLGEGVA